VKQRTVLERRHTALLVGLLAVLTLAVTYSTIEFLYRAALSEQRARLTEMARSQARLIEAIARHEVEAGRPLSSAIAITLDQVVTAHSRYESAARTGEFTLARREGDRIVFFLSHASATAPAAPSKIPFDSELAEPMRRALRGDSGTVIGLDYRGTAVVAAYEPVAVVDLGIVAKVDLSEIRAPFRRAGLIALGPAVAAILFGAWAFTRVSRPLVRRMEETQHRYEDVVEVMGDGLALQDAEGSITFVNDRLCQMLGRRRRDVLGRPLTDLISEESVGAHLRQMETLRPGMIRSYEAVLRCLDESSVHVLVTPRRLHSRMRKPAGSVVVVSEITDLKVMEAALRREKERAQLHLDVVGAMVVALDSRGRIDLVNRRASEVLGYDSPSDLVGRDWFSMCLPEVARAQTRAVFAKLMSGDVASAASAENAVLRRDGDTRLILWQNTILRDEEGRICGTLSSGEDITELRRQGERLAHLNAVLRAVRNVNQLITRETDRDRLLAGGCQELTGTEGVRYAWIVEVDSAGHPLRVGEAAVGEGFALLREQMLRGELPACCRRVLARGEAFVLTEPTEDCAGCPASVRYEDTAAVVVPLRHEARVYGVLVVAIPAAWAGDDEELSLFREVAGDLAYALHGLDTAEASRRAESALRTSEARYRSLFENAVLGIYQTTPDGRILAANPALVEMLGFDSFEELAERNLEEEGYAPEYSRSAFKGRLERDGFILGNEAAWQRTDGSVIHVRESAVAVRDEQGRVLYYEGTVEDMSARYEAEEAKARLEAQLRQTQKLESIGTLASGIAHEINNPLTGIINYAELIRTRAGEANSREFAQQIIDEGNRVAKTVRNLLSFARQERESHSPARMVDIVDATLSLVAAVLRRDRIEVVVEVPADLPLVRCRSQQIKQVVLNLVTNARDALNARFPEEDDRKRIAIRAVSVSRGDRRGVRLTVEDYGHGIPAAIRDRIFDPFFTTKPRDQGTGLGLSISYGIIREHRGTLTVECEENAYTRFTVELPALDEGDTGSREERC
jgi:PAS domain S-box-containing protein